MTAWQKLSPAVFDAELAAKQAAMEREAAATLFPELPRPVTAPKRATSDSKRLPDDVALFEITEGTDQQ